MKPQSITAAMAQQMANAYLATSLGHSYQATNGFTDNGYWYFLIRCCTDGRQAALTVGKLVVDSTTAGVIALIDEQLCQARERAAVQLAQGCRTLARDSQGYVLRTYAGDQATQWLSDHLGMHFVATEGQFLKTASPYWQFAIHFRLPHTGEIKALGAIQVDGVTGQVNPLTTQQTQTIQKRTRAILHDRALASAA
ncbi:MAG: hypothetical protein DYG89_38405 [Caldilinea sp. CFX5]|nr:hypothetical protein [Caldilinea sp. CFX5]